MTGSIGELTNIMMLRSGDQVYYFGAISSDKIKSMTFVPAIEKGEQKYLHEVVDDNSYQRPGSPSRMRSFAKFLKQHPNSVVPPIVISSRGKWSFSPTPSSEVIGSLALNGPAAIIDGQHRVGGYVHLYENETENNVRQVTFILLNDLSVADESSEFININNTQKGVPRALQSYLEDNEPAQIAWALNEDPDSPFHGRISRTTLAKSHLFALHSAANQMKELFKMGGLTDLDQDTKVSFASEYFTIVSDVFQTEWADIALLDEESSAGRRDFAYKILELTGLIAWCRAGSGILHRCYSSDLGMNWAAVRKLVEVAGDIDWSKTGKYEGRTGLAGARALTEEMELLITQSPPSAYEEAD